MNKHISMDRLSTALGGLYGDKVKFYFLVNEAF